jgi:hypothetical protein
MEAYTLSGTIGQEWQTSLPRRSASHGVKDNRVVEHWRVTDELSLMKQLGAVERKGR